MKINDKCLPCLVNQVVKVAEMTGAGNRDILYKKVFEHLSKVNFSEGTTPEIIGETFELLKAHIKNDDPYKAVRDDANRMVLDKLDLFSQEIESSDDSFSTAARFAAIGNIIDFNPIHNGDFENVMKTFEGSKNLDFTVNYILRLKEDIANKSTVLYLGDNCGEICLDKLFLKEIKRLNPGIEIYFATRGAPVVNDSIDSDAYEVGIDEYAGIISNGDSSMGTVLHRVSSEFKALYDNADIVIAKGQSNYECLSEENKNIYFMLITKCDVIANDIGIPQGSLVCLNKSI